MKIWLRKTILSRHTGVHGHWAYTVWSNYKVTGIFWSVFRRESLHAQLLAGNLKGKLSACALHFVDKQPKNSWNYKFLWGWIIPEVPWFPQELECNFVLYGVVAEHSCSPNQKKKKKALQPLWLLHSYCMINHSTTTVEQKRLCVILTVHKHFAAKLNQR